VNFLQIRNMVKTQLVEQSPDANVLAEINACINRKIQRMISMAPEAPNLSREVSVATLVSLSGDDATTEGGSREVSFSSDSGLDRRYIGAFIRLAGEQESYQILDVRVTNQAPNQIPRAIIDPPYTGAADGTSTSSVSFEILQMDYTVPRDVMRITQVKTSTSATRSLIRVDLSEIERSFSDPLIQGHQGIEPTVWADSGRTTWDFWGSDLDAQQLGTAGTLTVTNDSTIVATDDATFTTGAAGTFATWFTHLVSNRQDGDPPALHTNYFIGKEMWIEGDERFYPVLDVTHVATETDSQNATVVLQSAYKGSSGSSKRYVIGPRGSRRIRLFPIPTTPIHLDIRYRALPRDLVDDHDMPELPEEHHHVVALLASAELLLTLGGATQATLVKAGQLENMASQSMANYFREVNSLEDRPMQLRKAWATGRIAGRFSTPYQVTT